MKLLFWQHEVNEAETQRAAGIFGLGLIGQSIDQALGRRILSKESERAYDWKDKQRRDWHWKELTAMFAELSANGTVPRYFDVIWSAGQGGFSSTEDALAKETVLIEEILDHCSNLQAQFPPVSVRFHFISSAGAFFEGQTHVSCCHMPVLRRAYGAAKMDQENLIAGRTSDFHCQIYRPSSVYGFVPGGRFGLISALINNVLTNKVTRITGSPNTLRDYVFADDIGCFIANQVLLVPKNSADQQMKSPMILASGKAASMFEVIAMVERELGRPAYLMFDKEPLNGLPMSFLPSLLPENWQATAFNVGVHLTAARLQSHFANSPTSGR
ncbi:MAG: NAD-dependent epimerase/dehydratase family protein [Pseudomonadota bacterium]